MKNDEVVNVLIIEQHTDAHIETQGFADLVKLWPTRQIV